MEILFQGSKDVFLAKWRAQFDAVEDQALKSFNAIKTYSLVGTDPNAETLFTEMSNTTTEGDRAVWRAISVAGIQNIGNRSAGGVYPDANFVRGWETVVYDPDIQIAGKIQVPYEREVKEASYYKTYLNRSQKLLYETVRTNIADLWEVFNLGFTAPASYPSRFFAKGQGNTTGNPTNITNPMISTVQARADGGATQSNAITTSGNMTPFSDTAYWTARTNGGAFKDDVGKPYPLFGGRLTLVIPNNSLVRTAMELAGSEWKVGTANNDINIHYGMTAKVMSTPYLLNSYYVSSIANANQWFVIDENTRDGQVGVGLVKVLFVPLTTNVFREEQTDSVVYDIKNGYSQGWTDWRNILGSKGDNTAYSS